MKFFVVHSRARKKHVADGDLPQRQFDRGMHTEYQALCNGCATYGLMPEDATRFGPDRPPETDPWCKRCERRARKEGIIP